MVGMSDDARNMGITNAWWCVAREAPECKPGAENGTLE
jgi:hypothetical protein